MWGSAVFSSWSSGIFTWESNVSWNGCVPLLAMKMQLGWY